MYKAALTSGLLFAAWALPAVAADVTTVNTATFPNFIASTLTTAGTYYGAVDSTGNASITVNNITATKTWKVYARLTSSVPGLTVRVKLNGSAASGCAVSDGGVGYQTLTLSNTSQPIFSCSAQDASATAVPLQFQVEPTPAYGNGSKTFNVTYEAQEDP